jgi:hypothetical protein
VFYGVTFPEDNGLSEERMQFMESTVSQRTAEVWRQSFGYLEEKERTNQLKEIISKRIGGVGQDVEYAQRRECVVCSRYMDW